MGENQIYPELREIPWESSLCFTGHRPERLPEGESLRALSQTLRYYIDHAVTLGFTHFYTGLADGVDYLAAEYLFSLREQNPALYVIGVQPCRDYEAFFRSRGYSMQHLQTMLQNVDQLVVLGGSWRSGGCFKQRNQFMVDHASGIIAVCNDGRSGSMQTLRYAQRQRLAYCRIYAQPPYGTLPLPQNWPVERCGI